MGDGACNKTVPKSKWADEKVTQVEIFTNIQVTFDISISGEIEPSYEVESFQLLRNTPRWWPWVSGQIVLALACVVLLYLLYKVFKRTAADQKILQIFVDNDKA